MASGTIKGTFTNLSASHLYPEIRWRSTKNDTKNNSSVTAELWFVRVNTAYISNNAYFLPRITINGNAAYPPNGTYAPFDVRKGTRKVWQRTVTVAHNADGAKSITIAAGGITGLSNLGNVSVSGTAKLDTIPRASSIESISGNQIGGNITVNIKRASSSFTHRVGYYDTDGKRRSEIQDATTSTTFAVPLDRCNLLPNSTSGVAKIIVDTYSGSTRIGSVSKTHTVYVPSSVVPTVNSFNIKEGITKVANVKLPANNFVQNMSRLDMTAGASGKYNSTIKDYTFSFNGQSQGGMSGRQFSVGSAVGAFTAKVEVTDSRGRKASKSTAITIHAYNNPRINNFKIYRVDQTTQVKADINFTVSNINSKGGSWSIQKLVGTTWTNTNTGTLTTTHSATGLIVVGTYDVTKSQNFRVVLSDAFGTGATANGSISTAKTLMDFNKDKGIGIGKMHERGTLDVGGNTYINGVLSSGLLNVSTPTANPAGNLQNQLINFNRKDGTRHSGFDIGGDNDALRLHQYDKAGTWKSMHYFHPNGRVNFASHLTVHGWITASELWSSSFVKATSYVEGSGFQQRMSDGRAQAIYTTINNGVLWSGSYWLHEGQTLKMPKTIDQAPNGWIIVFQAYENGAPIARDFSYNVIHKTQTNHGFHAVFYSEYGDKTRGRYMYLRNRDTLEGSRSASIAYTTKMVLCRVLEF